MRVEPEQTSRVDVPDDFRQYPAALALNNMNIPIAGESPGGVPEVGRVELDGVYFAHVGHDRINHLAPIRAGLDEDFGRELLDIAYNHLLLAQLGHGARPAALFPPAQLFPELSLPLEPGQSTKRGLSFQEIYQRLFHCFSAIPFGDAATRGGRRPNVTPL